MDLDNLSESELDGFDSRREKVLLDAVGDYLGSNEEEELDSEEEVMALKHQIHEEDDDQEDGAEDGEGDEYDDEDDDEDQEDAKGWGSRRNYYGGDDASDDEDAKQMVEEALRQQKKHLQDLHMEDYVDEDMIEGWKKARLAEDEAAATFPLVDEEVELDFDAMDYKDKLKHLTGQYPEFVPLLEEFSTLMPRFEELKLLKSSDLILAKRYALSAYLSCISSYLALFVENLCSKEPISMKDHPVMESLLSSREVWRQADELRDAPRASKKTKAVDDSEYIEEGLKVDEIGETADLPESDLERLNTDSEEELDIEQAQQELGSDKELNINLSAKRTIMKSKIAFATGDYTETALPDEIDREVKDRRRKSLRFYTSKINQTVQKNARYEKLTGDLDLPYRERLFERQQRLLEEARKGGLGLNKTQMGELLYGDDCELDKNRMVQDINVSAAEYYDSVRSAKHHKKEARRTAHEEAKKAARDGKLAELQESAGADGKRALNFQILKNKGLTPHRKNENRNARVKKRKKYEQAKKKLKSVRQVYEGSQGPYGGEKTGIKKGISRSVKFI